jgi:DNA-binding CsgD family transcriptional regulator
MTNSYNSAFKYNESIIDKYNEISSPLKKHFNINVFGYMKVFDNGEYLSLTNDLKWQEFAFDNIIENSMIFQKANNQVEENNYTKLIWPNKRLDFTFNALYDFNIWNGVSILKRKENYVESWTFTSTREDEKIQDFLIKEFSALEYFINYFNIVGKEIISTDDKERLAKFILPKVDKESLYKNEICNFIESLKIDRYYFSKNEYITPKEFLCLAHMTFGKTTKEIARELMMSHRTVESHIQDVKLKTSISYRSSLIDFFLQKFSYSFIQKTAEMYKKNG